MNVWIVSADQWPANKFVACLVMLAVANAPKPESASEMSQASATRARASICFGNSSPSCAANRFTRARNRSTSVGTRFLTRRHRETIGLDY